MRIQTETVGDIMIVTFCGQHLDASTHMEFRNEITPVTEANDKIVFDIGEVEFVDSSGIGVILSMVRRVRERRGELRICRITPPVKAIFDLVRMNRLVEIYPTAEEAVKAFEA